MIKKFCKYRPNLFKPLYACALLIFALPFSAQASVDSGPSEYAPISQQDLSVESIDVVGKYPLAYFRRNVVRKEDAFFDLMNTLVEDEDYKVTCKKRNIQSFSRLKQRKCEAHFVSRIVDEYTQANFDFLSQGSLQMRAEQHAIMSLGNPMSVQRQIRKKQKEQLSVMTELINSNAALLEAFNELELAKYQLRLAENKK